MTIFLDFETRSVVDLKKCGATRYAQDPLTQVLCFCWSFDQSPVVDLWHRDHPWITRSEFPQELCERIASGELVEAHNAGFEMAVWWYTLSREFPEFREFQPTLEQMRCSAAKASCVSLPRALDEALHAIHAPAEFLKLSDGKRLIQKLSKPRPKKKGQTEIIWCEEEIEHRRNWEYCAQDIRAERYLSDWCPDMTERELEYWQMDQRMNQRGIALDSAAANRALKLCASETARLDAEMLQLTDGQVPGGAKRAKFRAWMNGRLGTRGYLVDTRADTLSFALHGVPTKAGEAAKAARKDEMVAKWAALGDDAEPLRRSMDICMEVNRTSNSKYKTMLSSVCADGRLHDIMLYNGADRPVSGDAEVLTRQGWQRIDGWAGGDIAQWAHQKGGPGEITFGPATRAEFPYTGDMVRMAGPSTELLCTLDHKIPLISCRDNLSDFAAGNVRECNWALPLAGNYRSGVTEPPEHTRLVVMYQADGRTPDGPALSLHFRKQRKIDRCKSLLRATSLAFEERIDSDGSTNIKIIEAPEWLCRSKEFGEWLLNHNPAVFIAELEHWDGTTDKRNTFPGISYSTRSKNNAEWVQTMAALAGTRAHIEDRGIRNPGWNRSFRVHVHNSGARSWLKKNWSFKREPSSGTVYCARTQTGYFLVRYNGTIQVTGNTGRWSGKGVQPHNFVRGYSKEMSEVWDDILALNRDGIEIMWGNPLPALAKACRGALIASPGYELYAADFNAIEARKLAWMANCIRQLELFSSGGDPYIAMACGIYKLTGIDYTDKGVIDRFKKEHADERQLGKRAVLGLGYCHAADTLILTRRGWVRIDRVGDWDMLWDGQEWVPHRGLICNGEKYVTNLGGTFPTMDHPVWCGERFHRAEKVVADADLSRRVLKAGAEVLPLRDMSSGRAAAFDASWLGANVARPSNKSIWRIGARVAQRAATLARNVRRRIQGTLPINLPCQMLSLELCGSIDSPPQSVVAITPETRGSRIMAQEALRFASSGIRTAPRSYDTFRLFRDGIIRSLKWIERTMIAAMSRAIFAARLGASNASTRAGQKEKVYDLLDAGPRHRYMILTKDGPVLVHNSMGWEKFQATVWAEEGIWLDDEFCQMVVSVYRKQQCPEMPVLWKTIGEAAIKATTEGGEWTAGGDPVTGQGSVTYFMNDTRPFLHCRLPSGRLLAYLYPEVHTKLTWRFHALNEHGKACFVSFPSKRDTPQFRARWHAEKMAEKQRKKLVTESPETFLSPHLSFMGRHIITRRWQRIGTHGGSLTENADQASSRDLLAEAMYRVDLTGVFRLLLSIHDEVIAEAPIGTATRKEFEALMSEVPIWATGMSISAEGWIGQRLRK
jgi:hypothetical protein